MATAYYDVSGENAVEMIYYHLRTTQYLLPTDLLFRWQNRIDGPPGSLSGAPVKGSALPARVLCLCVGVSVCVLTLYGAYTDQRKRRGAEARKAYQTIGTHAILPSSSPFLIPPARSRRLLSPHCQMLDRAHRVQPRPPTYSPP